ncbi:hypothetical protein V6N13_027009 [Hibiscus sabdariffa]|uniref:Uncharacterized protein n=2 Tax=Hibiscus sabdariffa TaxID=183260 RepID=A0ABR2B418_9ROSI
MIGDLSSCGMTPQILTVSSEFVEEVGDPSGGTDMNLSVLRVAETVEHHIFMHWNWIRRSLQILIYLDPFKGELNIALELLGQTI